VAITWNSLEVDVLLLLLTVLVAGMLALKRFAEMRIRLERLVAERTEALEDKTRQLEELAAQDTLTGLFNRRRADEVLRREFARAVRTGHPLCIALADIDHFKQINDGHSHGIGDRVLERWRRSSPTACASPTSWRATAARSSCSASSAQASGMRLGSARN